MCVCANTENGARRSNWLSYKTVFETVGGLSIVKTVLIRTGNASKAHPVKR